MKKDIVFLGVRVSVEAKKKIEKIAKLNRRSVAKEIERLIMELEVLS